MGKYSKKGNVLCLLLLSLFLMEYLNPSAIGVRAYFDSPLTQENPDHGKSIHSPRYGFLRPSELNTILLVNSVVPLPKIVGQQSVFFPIFRPPISLRCHL